ncbi:VOC family protein [Solitalea koreensis]|uniref:Lactoylglutathione lyase n=1 Tax=Solitalea koreensis TaxID=543615 RepID=A0A521DD90_9SPHI|nr:VOC family protein [Solitalea koreensis]SMO69552.1 lactoylglutathione lyase [Solitalea koreensis]
MIKTRGLTHIALKVKDVKRSSRFYQKVFGTDEMYNAEGFIQVQTPGSHDIIVFEQSEIQLAQTGGIIHFGFRLIHIEDIKNVVKEVEDAGGIIKEQGEFCPGEPYVLFYDPDGYEIEVWYELPLARFN